MIYLLIEEVLQIKLPWCLLFLCYLKQLFEKHTCITRKSKNKRRMEIVVAIASKVGEYLVEPTINQVRYLLCFTNIVKDLTEAETDLELAQDRVKQRVQRATDNAETVEKDVEKWLKDASDILAEVQRLKDEIKVNKTCFKGWCPNWGWRYRLSGKAAKKTSKMLKLGGDSSKFITVSHTTTLPGIGFLAPKDFDLFESSKFAFDRIIEALKNDQTSLVGLYGMGGAGKTTLAKAVGNKVEEEKIFDKVVLVVLSQVPDFRKIQAVIADSLGLQLKEESEDGRARHLYLRFTETNKEAKKKILVILDDAWEKFDLKSKIGFPFGEDNKDCKILLTTRKLQLCIDMDCRPRIPLDLLSEDEGLALLKRHAGISNGSHNLNALALEVARECKGLPLAIVTIGSALKEKGVHEWKLVVRQLQKSKLPDIHNFVDVDKDVYASLKLSYDFLKGEKTKFCFLLCSLFPEDYEIPLEELVQYGAGLGLFPDADLVENARIELRGLVNKLKDSVLLLDAGDEELVKMHDVVRDVALWIASQGERVFMVKAGMGLTEWPDEEGLEHCTAISLIGNYIKVLPNDLYCPKLEILLMEGASSETEVPDEFFKEMKRLKVLSLRFCDLSLKSLQLLANLKTLELRGCNLRDLSYLVKLNKLEILSFQDSNFDELPRELGELRKLRKLDLVDCGQLIRIPPNVIQRCSQLEELQIIDSFTGWEIEETRAEGSNASVLELNSLSHLVILRLRIDAKYIPKDFAFPKLLKHAISMNNSYNGSYQRALKLSDIEATSLTAFESLYETLEYLGLDNIGCQNIFPSMHQEDLKELKELKISNCGALQEVFQLEGLCLTGNENVLRHPRLAILELKMLPQLHSIWKGPTHHIDLKSLTYLRIDSCESLEHLFPISIAGGLVHLQRLFIRNAPRLKQVFYLDHGNVTEEDGKDIFLPKLRELTLEGLDGLTSFLPENCHLFCSALEELKLSNCSNLTTTFPSEVTQGIKEKLRVLEIKDCPHELCDGLMLACLRNGFKNLEKLRIKGWGRKVAFQLEGLVSRQQHELLLPNLKELSIEDCGELEQFITLEDNSQLEEIFGHKGGADVMDDEESTVLPQLRKLSLKALPSLTNFCPVDYHFISTLRVLEIEDCHHELYDGLLLPSFRYRFKNLEKLRIKGCGVKVVFQLDGLITATDGQQHELLLPNLKEFSIEDCGELEQIIVEEDYMQPLSFPNLSRINVKRCKKLKHLFPITVVQSLQKLQCITLRDNSQLEKIFGDRDGADVVDNKEIMLPQLEKLSLKALPNLTNFCPVGYHFISTLRALVIEDCHHELYDGLMLRSFRHGFKNLEKLRIKGWGVKVVFQLEALATVTDAQQHELLLPNLKELSIEDCGELEQIIVEKDYMQPLAFPNLSRINVKRCNKLKHLLPISKVQSLEKLEYITLEDNSELEEIFGPKDGADAMADEEKIVLPQLKELSLKALPSFSNFSPSDSCCILSLRVLRLEGLKQQLCDGIVGCLSQYEFKNLEEIRMEECGVTVVFDLEGVNEQQRQLSLPSLKELRLISLEELEHLCKGPTHLLKLENLALLDLYNCGQVRYIFTPSLAQNLSKLEMLYVRDCGELEKIMVEDDEEEDDIQPHLLFPNLRSIHVWRCKKLKRVFPITIARGLQQLYYLKVEDNSQLEEVFGHKDGAQVMDNKAITLPQLEWLCLEELPRLTNFCHVGYNFIFPSLKNGRLRVRECGKIATRFSWDEKDSTVHAEAKPLNSKEGSNDDEERTMDIDCEDSNELRANLPPYMEQIRTEGITPSTSRRET